jgi:FkbM family methyltransferase
MKNSPYQTDGYLGYQLFQEDIEKNYPEIADIAVGEDCNVLLIGAWRGDEINSFLKWKQIGKIFAFEPNPANYHYLAKAFAGNPKVKTFELACGDFNGDADLHVQDSESGSESLLPVSDTATFSTIEKKKVKVTKLDSVEELRHVPVTLLWIDIQGFELAAFKGGVEVLKNTRGIFVELNGSQSMYQDAAHHEQIDAFLAAQGFYRAWLEMAPDQEVNGGVALYLKNGVSNDAMSAERIAMRIPQLIRAMQKKNTITKLPLYRVLGKVLPVRIKSKIKSFIRS